MSQSIFFHGFILLSQLIIFYGIRPARTSLHSRSSSSKTARSFRLSLFTISMTKRRRETESEIRAAIEELSLLRLANRLPDSPIRIPPEGAGGTAGGSATSDPKTQQVSISIPTRPLLVLCSLVLQVLDKIGPTMTVLRQDVNQNIQRLEKRLNSDPAIYSNVIEILKKEASQGKAMKRHSCSKALLWLTRSLDMTVALLETIARDPNQSMEQAVKKSYNLTLKSWHGWISLAAFKVVTNMLPDNKTFIQLVSAKGENLGTLKGEIHTFISLIEPLLDDLHFAMKMFEMDQVMHT